MYEIEQLLPEQLVAYSLGSTHNRQRTGFVVTCHLVECFADTAYRVAHLKTPSE